MTPLPIVVLGLGRAGAARVRELRALPEAFTVVGAVTRRPEAAAALSLPVRALVEVLGDAGVGAVAVCTENARHEAEVGAALAAGKDVLVEYPLALSAAAGRALFAAAHAVGRCLYEGHVELCSEPHRRFAAELRERGRPRELTMTFTGRAEARMTTVAEAGFPSFSGFARLNRLVDLAGVLEVAAVRYEPSGEQQGEGFRLEADFRALDGLRVRWCESRAPSLPRFTECVARYANGAELRGYGAARPGPVFARDTARFAAALTSGLDLGPEQARIEHCLDLAEELRRRA